MTEQEVKFELNDKNKYKNLTDLRNAAGPLLNTNEGRKIPRNELIELILSNYRSKKAMGQFGR